MGRVLRTLRRARELSQVEIALKAELNLSYYSRIERGEANPTIKTVLKILATLDVPYEDYWGMVSLEKQHFNADPLTDEDHGSEDVRK
ncbi:MAG: helix-turn-helix transcriptional regulator [Clostridiales bacterium]|nr:helix-turn-helix transcriptional regulator [Clostridiales bacterium]